MGIVSTNLTPSSAPNGLVTPLHPDSDSITDLNCCISSYLPFVPQTSLKKGKVKVFDQPSRNDNMIVEIIRETEKEESLEKAANEMLGKIIWVGWPHLTRAKYVYYHVAHSCTGTPSPPYCLPIALRDYAGIFKTGSVTRP